MTTYHPADNKKPNDKDRPSRLVPDHPDAKRQPGREPAYTPPPPAPLRIPR
jgi:hypothetical protein